VSPSILRKDCSVMPWVGQAAKLGVEVALRREARLAERAAAQPDLAVAVGILPVDERDRDLGPVEQAGAHLVLDDTALGEHPDQVEVVDGKARVAPDRGAREARVRPVGVAGEDDVPVVVGEEECLPVRPRDPPDGREPRRLLIEMRPHGGHEGLSHGSAEGQGKDEDQDGPKRERGGDPEQHARARRPALAVHRGLDGEIKRPQRPPGALTALASRGLG
jgi:hypothetical protein